MTTATKLKNITITTEQIEKIERILDLITFSKTSFDYQAYILPKFEVGKHKEITDSLTAAVKFAKIQDIPETLFWLKYSILLLTYQHACIQDLGNARSYSLSIILSKLVQNLDHILAEILTPEIFEES